MVAVIIASDCEIKKVAFESSDIAAYLRIIGVNYSFINVDGVDCREFEGTRWVQPFRASGGIFAAMKGVAAAAVKHYDDTIVIAIENYITEDAKDCVCIVVNYYDGGRKHEMVSFSPDAYVASFPDKYLQHLVLTYGNREGFGVTIGEVINMEKHLYGGGVSKNWHKLFNPFDHVEQIRGSLNYIADEFKKIVS